MSKPENKEVIALQEAYANIYNEIVKPDHVFVATQYFRQKWVPLLGPALGWVILALRQHCYWSKATGEKRDWCIISQEELATEVGLSVATLKRLLKEKYVDLFIVDISYRYRYDREKRKQVRKNSRYRIRMDDPLVPEDEERLKKLLAEKLAGLDIDPETGQVDFLRLLNQLAVASSLDLPLNLSYRSDEPQSGNGQDKLDQSAGELAQRLGQLLTGSPPSSDQTNPYPDAVALTEAELPGLELASDRVLVGWNGGYLAVPIVEVVKRDVRRSGGNLSDQWRTDCFYSVQDALGEGPEDWLPDERTRLEQMRRLEQELSAQYQDLGGFNLGEALGQYFKPSLAARFLEAAQDNPTEQARIQAWVSYTRHAKGLKNPAGFLRTSLESDEFPAATPELTYSSK